MAVFDPSVASKPIGISFSIFAFVGTKKTEQVLPSKTLELTLDRGDTVWFRFFGFRTLFLP